eukprot:jgi/Mesen1/9474/ME000063S08921
MGSSEETPPPTGRPAGAAEWDHGGGGGGGGGAGGGGARGGTSSSKSRGGNEREGERASSPTSIFNGAELLSGPGGKSPSLARWGSSPAEVPSSSNSNADGADLRPQLSMGQLLAILHARNGRQQGQAAAAGSDAPPPPPPPSSSSSSPAAATAAATPVAGGHYPRSASAPSGGGGGAGGAGRIEARFISYSELATATNAFAKENIIGKGGYAVVYRGFLSGGKKIAVKKLVRKTGGEIEFLSEVGIVSHVRHPHAARLIGYSVEKDQRLLVYDLMPHGSLERNLHSKNREPASWERRVRVAIGSAKGLEYLHCECPRRIVHRDVKTANILISNDWEAQIADFGLAKWLPDSGISSSSGPVEGTFGYMAPEYFMHAELNEKTDVYSLGVVLLEIITGRRPIDVQKEGIEQNLVAWAQPMLEGRKLHVLADPRLHGKVEGDSLARMAAAVLMCLRSAPSQRPTMGQVAEFLEDKSITEPLVSPPPFPCSLLGQSAGTI